LKNNTMCATPFCDKIKAKYKKLKSFYEIPRFYSKE